MPSYNNNGYVELIEYNNYNSWLNNANEYQLLRDLYNIDIDNKKYWESDLRRDCIATVKRLKRAPDGSTEIGFFSDRQKSVGVQLVFEDKGDFQCYGFYRIFPTEVIRKELHELKTEAELTIYFRKHGIKKVSDQEYQRCLDILESIKKHWPIVSKFSKPTPKEFKELVSVKSIHFTKELATNIYNDIVNYLNNNENFKFHNKYTYKTTTIGVRFDNDGRGHLYFNIGSVLISIVFSSAQQLDTFIDLVGVSYR